MATPTNGSIFIASVGGSESDITEEGGLLAESYAMIGSISNNDFTPNYAFKVANQLDSYLSGKLAVGGQVDIGTQMERASLTVTGDTTLNGLLTVSGTAGSTALEVTGTVSATKFEGDGSGLTGLPSSSQWKDGSGSIYYNGGNVGIGTNQPEAALDVRGAMSFRGTNETQGFFPLGGLDPDLRFIVGSTVDGDGDGFQIERGGLGKRQVTVTDPLSGYNILYVLCSAVGEGQEDSPVVNINYQIDSNSVLFTTTTTPTGGSNASPDPSNEDFSFLIVLKK